MERFAMIGDKGRTAEEQHEELESMLTPSLVTGECVGAPIEKIGFAARQIENLAKVDFEEILCDRERPFEIEAPVPPVGEHAPSEAAFGHVIDATEITQHLC